MILEWTSGAYDQRPRYLGLAQVLTWSGVVTQTITATEFLEYTAPPRTLDYSAQARVLDYQAASRNPDYTPQVR